jgi:hypothetical protein
MDLVEKLLRRHLLARNSFFDDGKKLPLERPMVFCGALPESRGDFVRDVFNG